MQQSAVIEYNHDGYQCEGFAVWDTAGPNRPGVMVFPEWVGVGEYTQKRAQMLGELGFNAFVVDVYGKGIRPNTPSASGDDEICDQSAIASTAGTLRS
jgi:dienelactone hydrolase